MVLSDSKRTVLRDLYENYKKPQGLSCDRTLYEFALQNRHRYITWIDVKKYLKSPRAYSLHRNFRKKKFPCRQTIAMRRHKILVCDLADMRHLVKHNNGVGHLLLCVDVFNRYMQLRSPRSKCKTEVTKVLKHILDMTEIKGTSRHLYRCGRLICK